MKLGLDWYTLRWQPWDTLELLRYTASLGFDTLQLGRNHFPSLEEQHLRPVKRLADELGVLIEFGMGSVDQFSSAFQPQHGSAEEQLTTTLRTAAYFGSPSVHVLLGGLAERVGPLPLSAHIAECVRVSKAVAPLARDLGIKLAFETHGDLLGHELVGLVEEAGPDTVGVCLDTGNPALAAEDPVVTTELLARYTVTGHIRDSRVWAVPEGAMVQHVPMGQGSVDMKRIAALLKEQAPNAIFALEILTGFPPRLLPYLNPQTDFWQAYPETLASDFCRFLALAQTGQPEPLEQVILPAGQRTPPPGELGERLLAQQRRHLEESVTYCREVLGVGERGR